MYSVPLPSLMTQQGSLQNPEHTNKLLLKRPYSHGDQKDHSELFYWDWTISKTQDKTYHLLSFSKTGKNVTFQLWGCFSPRIIPLYSADNQDVYSAINIKPAYAEWLGGCFDSNSAETNVLRAGKMTLEIRCKFLVLKMITNS